MHGGPRGHEGAGAEARLALARRDLDEAREADLATMDPAAMALLVERLRASLHDVLQLVEEQGE